MSVNFRWKFPFWCQKNKKTIECGVSNSKFRYESTTFRNLVVLLGVFGYVDGIRKDYIYVG